MITKTLALRRNPTTVPKRMSRALSFSLTLLAMLAFAGNSLLCRLALKSTSIDPASFTAIRLVSGALVLALISRLRGGRLVGAGAGSWRSALALFAYVAGFSYAYVSLSAATGALLLFGAVQATMIGYGLWAGERLDARQTVGLLMAFGGLASLLLPGLSAPPLAGALLMLGAGVAWGIYSLRGRAAGDPTQVTAGNFLRAAPIALALSALTLPWQSLDGAGVAYALASGAIASGMGYAVWYTALRGLTATHAASAQLSVPLLATLGGIALLGEPASWRLVWASVAILGGLALVLVQRAAARR